MSLRSKGNVNVAAIAEGLGGGGHENAAGCTIDGPLGRALEEILAVLRPCVASGVAKQDSRSG
jgi:phosphoesterase RecJ-like protein